MHNDRTAILTRLRAKVAIFDINEEAGEALAKEVGGVFCNVDIMSEESCEAGFAKPSPVVFEESLRQLGRPAASVLHVGDGFVELGEIRREFRGDRHLGFSLALFPD